MRLAPLVTPFIQYSLREPSTCIDSLVQMIAYIRAGFGHELAVINVLEILFKASKMMHARFYVDVEVTHMPKFLRLRPGLQGCRVSLSQKMHQIVPVPRFGGTQNGPVHQSTHPFLPVDHRKDLWFWHTLESTSSPAEMNLASIFLLPDDIRPLTMIPCPP